MSHTNKKKDTGEKKTTVGTYRNADYLLKTTFSKHNNMLVFFLNSSILIIFITENFLEECLFTQ